jgi:TRAP-type C4-dicarboxylate transport system substrate-binding protein
VGPIIKWVNKLSQGRIKISLHGVGTLVPTKQLLEAVGNGTVDMATVAEGYWYKLVPVSIIGQGLPFCFVDNIESVYFMYFKGFVKLLRQAYAKHNVYVIPYEPYNTGLMTRKPILKASDLKGLKLRAFGTMQMWLSMMGASTVYIPGGELYTALSTGVVSGAHWGDAYPMYELKFQEVLKNYMLPEPIIGSWNCLWINLDVWKKFTPQQRALIQAAAFSGGMLHAYYDTRARYKFALRDMKKKWKVKINRLPPAQVEKMRAAAKKVWRKLAAVKDPLARKGFKLLYEFLAELGRPVK